MSKKLPYRAKTKSSSTSQRFPTNQDDFLKVPPIVREVLRSPEEPLDPQTRAFFEARFGCDFSKVRIHTNAKAVESARAVNGLAYSDDIEKHLTHYTEAIQETLGHSIDLQAFINGILTIDTNINKGLVTARAYIQLGLIQCGPSAKAAMLHYYDKSCGDPYHLLGIYKDMWLKK